METKLQDFKSIVLKIASPEDILEWSHGEVTKPETINYRTQRAEKDGLFCEKIFGPEKDWECYCGKYRRIRYKGIVCDKCGVEVTRSIVRRERMGHIKLASPVSHIWFLQGVPSKIGTLLDVSAGNLEKVIYFTGYIVTKINNDARNASLDEIEKEYKAKLKVLEKDAEKESLKALRDRAKWELNNLRKWMVLAESEYRDLSLKFADVFEAGTGAEALRKILEGIDLTKMKSNIISELSKNSISVKKKLFQKLKLVDGMIKARLRPEWMILTTLPVIPPELRPMVQLEGGRYATSDLNDLYRRVINRNNRLKRLFELNAPEVICRNEKRMLQEAIDALIDNTARRGTQVVTSTAQKRPLKSLADVLKGKQGRFRQNLLGKRVDYSGRSVIVVGPELKLHQCGLPKKMALELFKPFVIQKLIKQEIVFNPKGASKLIEKATNEVWAILEEVIKGKYVLLNRAPTLHRLGIQAFQPVLIEGEAIQVHPLVCSAFNADFDGDQMAVHLPLADEAQVEAKEIMLASKNILKPATGEPVAVPTQDIVLGCYWMTAMVDDKKGEGLVFGSSDEAIFVFANGKFDLKSKIKVRITDKKINNKDKVEMKSNSNFVETCVGRLFFNEILPDDFEFINKTMDKKSLSSLLSEIYAKYGIDSMAEILDKIKVLGFENATKSGISWGMNDLKVPEEKKNLIKIAHNDVEKIFDQYQKGFLTDEERYDRVIEIWHNTKRKIDVEIQKNLDTTSSVYSIITSKARGTLVQLTQMSGMKGLVANPTGATIELPITSSYKEGFDVLEYFISTHGARKGTADTALKTSAAGYLTRRLVDVAQDVIISEEDCKTKNGIRIFRKDSEQIGRDFVLAIFGRVLLFDVLHPETKKVIVSAGDVINSDLAKEINSSGVVSVAVRSSIACQSEEGVCQKCYGYDLGNSRLIKIGEAIGIVAAQSIGEPGTQLTMRTFHSGGVAGAGDITSGLPRVQEIFESRNPKNQAIISDVDGEVVDIIEREGQKFIQVKIIETEEQKRKKAEKQKDKKKKKQAKGIVSGKFGEIKEFPMPSRVAILVGLGQKISKSDQLCEGHINLKELFISGGIGKTQKYILNEIQKIYALQGAPINDKHIEVIIKQMFSRVRIKESGNTKFVVGDIVEKNVFRKENKRVKANGGKTAVAYQLLFGITKASLTTESFLSAASFQETAKVLISAAVEGKEDKLKGLKENVIVGRLIPAGTGYKKSGK